MVKFILFIIGIIFVGLGLLFFAKALEWKFNELDKFNEWLVKQENGKRTKLKLEDKTKSLKN